MSHTYGLFDFSIKFIPHQFNGISVPWLCQLRNQLKNILFLFTFNVLLTEFTSMLWVIFYEYKSLTHKLHSRWDCMMIQYAVIAGLIQFALHLEQIPIFTIGKNHAHHNTASSMLYDWCDTGGCSSFTNTSLHIDPPIWPKDFKLGIVSPKDFIPMFYCPVFEHLRPLEPFDIVFLLPQQWSLDSNSVI